MKLSIFTTYTAPSLRQDPFREALQCYCDLADEVVAIDGFDGTIDFYHGQEFHHTVRDKECIWKKDFKWEFIGQQFQRAYEHCTGDWVIHADIDFIFHEKDFQAIKQILEQNSDAPAMSFYKYQFILTDRFRLKSRLVIAVNKGKFGDRIRFDGGGDLCQPTLDGKYISPDDVPEIGIPFYNYDFCFKEQKVIEDDWVRFRKAYKECFDKDFGEYIDMQVGRFGDGSGFKKIAIEDHPIYIQAKIRNTAPDRSGYDLFGNIKR